MKIEKYKKLRDDNYRILLDNGTIIDVHEDVIVKNNLLYKKEVDNELLIKIENDNEYQNAYNTALKYLSIRLRSINEVEVYLKKKNVKSEIIDNIVERLIRNNFLNDEVFTKAFIKDKLSFTTMGKYKIFNELKKLRVNESIISANLEDIEEDIWYERIEKLVNKYLKTKRKYSGNILKNKIYMYLVNLGYDKDIVINALNKYDF